MMRALTLWQPWGWAIVAGYKAMENRPWPPPQSAIGQRLAIHAGKTWDRDGARSILDLIAPDAFPDDLSAHVAGAVIGVATPVRVVRDGGIGVDGVPHVDTLTDDERRWFFGPYGWVLREVVRLPEPVPCRGYQMLWTLPDDVEAQVRAQLARAA